MAHPLCVSSGLYYSIPWSGAEVGPGCGGVNVWELSSSSSPPARPATPIPTAQEIALLLRKRASSPSPEEPSNARPIKTARIRHKNDDSRLETLQSSLPSLPTLPALASLPIPASDYTPAPPGAGGVAPSNALLKSLKHECERMLAAGVIYEDDYWTDPRLDPYDDEHKKLYLINAGDPMDPNRVQSKSKNVTAYVGASRNPIAECVYDKNNPQVVQKDPETRHAMTRWLLFCIVIFPREWEARSIDTAMQYLRCGHGVVGKLKRCFEVAELFNLRCHVPPERESFVKTQCPRALVERESVKFKGGPEGPP